MSIETFFTKYPIRRRILFSSLLAFFHFFYFIKNQLILITICLSCYSVCKQSLNSLHHINRIVSINHTLVKCQFSWLFQCSQMHFMHMKWDTANKRETIVDDHVTYTSGRAMIGKYFYIRFTSFKKVAASIRKIWTMKKNT